MYLNSSQVDKTAELLRTMSSVEPCHDVFERVGHTVLDVVGADLFSIYYRKSGSGKKMACAAQLNHDPGLIDGYDTYFHTLDPLHNRMYKHKTPVVASSVMPTADLTRTEFYNDFLKPNGMLFGMNIYFHPNDEYIGDIRVWRSPGREDFSPEDGKFLQLLGPLFSEKVQQFAQPRTMAPEIPLTPREQDVFDLLCRGASDKEIIRSLSISMSTTRTHVNRILEKTGCASRSHLILKYAVKSGT